MALRHCEMELVDVDQLLRQKLYVTIKSVLYSTSNICSLIRWRHHNEKHLLSRA